jgi:Zn-dependent metalloprotease
MKRLSSTAPAMPASVLERFALQFEEEQVSKPAETNGLSKITVYNEELKTPVPKISNPPVFVDDSPKTKITFLSV